MTHTLLSEPAGSSFFLSIAPLHFPATVSASPPRLVSFSPFRHPPTPLPPRVPVLPFLTLVGNYLASVSLSFTDSCHSSPLPSHTGRFLLRFSVSILHRLLPFQSSPFSHWSLITPLQCLYPSQTLAIPVLSFLTLVGNYLASVSLSFTDSCHSSPLLSHTGG